MTADVSVEPYVPFPSFLDFSSGELDVALFDVFATRLTAAKEASTQEQLSAAVSRATRSAAADTGAIEGLYEVDRGFTMSVAAEATAWNDIHLVKGEEAARMMNDALRGYEFVMDSATGAKPVSQSWIRELHSVLCANQKTYNVLTSQGLQEQPLPLGSYKEHPNNPVHIATRVIHSYASVTDTPIEMQRFIDELRTPEFVAAHPVIQASYAHYAFVCIHPFADGNGRVARALASVFLYRSPGVPLVIFADQKPQYLDALELADAGDVRGLVKFIGDRAIDAVRMVITDVTNAVPLSTREDRIAQLQGSLLGRGGLPHEMVDALALQLLNEYYGALMQANESTPAPPPIQIQIRRENSNLVISDQRFRPMPTGVRLLVFAQVPPPAGISVQRISTVAVARPGFEEYDFALIRSDNVIMGQFYIRDLHPVVSAAAAYTLRSLAEAELWWLEAEASTAAETALRNKGYL